GRRTGLITLPTRGMLRGSVHLAARTMPTPAPTVQREAIRLAIESIVWTLPLVGRLRAVAGDEGRQPLAIALLGPPAPAAALRTSPVGLLVARRIGLGLAARVMLMLARIGLRLARRVGLWLRFAAERRIDPVILLGIVRALLARLAFRTEVRLALPELLLGGGDHPGIVLGVLIVVLGRDGIAGRLRVAGKLDVFFRDVGSGAADFDVGTVRFVDPGQGILALAVAPPHAFVLTVSHGSSVHLLPFAALARPARFSPARTPSARDRSAASRTRESTAFRTSRRTGSLSITAATSSPRPRSRCCQPLIPRAASRAARQPGDAASRVPSRRIRALQGLSASPHRSLQESCSGPLWRRVTVV